jgi:hypothetical protein
LSFRDNTLLKQRGDIYSVETLFEGSYTFMFITYS